MRRYDTQHNAIQHIDTHHKGLICDTLHNNTQYLVPLSCVSCFIYCYTVRHYAECRGAAYVLNFETSEEKAHLHIQRKQSKYEF